MLTHWFISSRSRIAYSLKNVLTPITPDQPLIDKTLLMDAFRPSEADIDVGKITLALQSIVTLKKSLELASTWFQNLVVKPCVVERQTGPIEAGWL